MSQIKGEIQWVGYYDINGERRYVITSKPTRDVYYLYSVEDGVYKKIGKAKTPDKLVEDNKVIDSIRSIKPKRKAGDEIE